MYSCRQYVVFATGSFWTCAAVCGESRKGETAISRTMGLDDMVRDAHIKEKLLLEMTAGGGGKDYSIIEKYSFEGSEVNDAKLDALEQVPMSYKGALDRAGDLGCVPRSRRPEKFIGGSRARATLAPTRARNLSRAGYSFAFHTLKHLLYLDCLAHRGGPLTPEDVKLCEVYTRNDILEHVAKTTTDEALRASIEDYLANVMPGHLETVQAEVRAARDAALPPSTGTWGSDPA